MIVNEDLILQLDDLGGVSVLGAGRFAVYCPLCKHETKNILFTLVEPGKFEVYCECGCPARQVIPGLHRAIEAETGVENGHKAAVLAEIAPVAPEYPPDPRPPERVRAPERVTLFPLITFDEVCDLPPPIWMIEGFFHEQSFVQIYGETSSGKSLLGMDLALNIAMGSEVWFGREILKHGPVVWINADGGRGITPRALAWREAHGDKLEYPFLVLMGAVQMNRADQMNSFRRQLLAMEEKPVLVVFDTQSRCMPGADENGQGDMTLVTDGCHRIKNEVGCTIVLLHHADKTGQWERGSGVVKNETDTQIRVDMDQETKIATVSSRKARDSDNFKSFRFGLKRVLDSVVIVQVEGDGPETTGDKMSKQQRYEEKVVELLALNPGGATRRDLEMQANAEENDQQLYAALRHLEATGKIIKRDDPLSTAKHRKPQRYWLCGPSETTLEGIDLAD